MILRMVFPWGFWLFFLIFDYFFDDFSRFLRPTGASFDHVGEPAGWEPFVEVTSQCFAMETSWFKWDIKGGAPKIAKLVNITPITMVYGTQITSYNYSIHGVNLNQLITGGPHLVPSGYST